MPQQRGLGFPIPPEQATATTEPSAAHPVPRVASDKLAPSAGASAFHADANMAMTPGATTEEAEMMQADAGAMEDL
eukprot:2311049-Heterocapsa_arctica.AAC.1